MTKNPPIVYRGEIYYADLSPVIGREQGGLRPVIVIQNNMGNYYAPTVIVAPLTSKTEKCYLPTHVLIKQGANGTKLESLALLEQIRTIDKSRLQSKVGAVTEETTKEIDKAIKVSLGLT